MAKNTRKKNRRRVPREPSWSPVYTTTENYEYSYDLQTFEGRCQVTGKRIFVFTECSEFDGVLSVLHPNYLRCLYTNVEAGHIICECVGVTVVDYVNSKEKIVTFDLPFPKTYQPRPDQSKLTLPYLHPDVRHIFLQMFTFLYDMHNLDTGLSLHSFGLKNLRVEDTTLKFCGIGFKSESKTVDRMKNYETVYEIIKEDLLDGQSECLPTLVDLFKRTKQLTYASPKQPSWVLEHLAIASPTGVIDFLYMCNEKIGKSIDDYAGSPYVTVMNGVTNCDNWDSVFLRDYRYMVVQSCYRFRNAEYIRTRNNHLIKLSLLKFIRNMLAHLNQHLVRTSRLTDAQMEAVIMSLFSRQILETASSLIRQFGDLKEFMKVEPK